MTTTCSKHFPGHTPHWIQVRKSHDDSERATVVRDGDWLVVTTTNGRRERLWTHAHALDRCPTQTKGPNADYSRSKHLIRFDRDGYCVSVATEPSPCRTDPPTTPGAEVTP